MAREKVDHLTKALVGTRDEVRCIFCHIKVRSAKDSRSTRRTIDHLIPLSDGGTNKACNVAVACAGCNGDKASTWPGPFILAQSWPEAMKVAALDRVMTAMDCKITGLWPEWQRGVETSFGHWGSLVAGLRKKSGAASFEPAKVISLPPETAKDKAVVARPVQLFWQPAVTPVRYFGNLCVWAVHHRDTGRLLGGITKRGDLYWVSEPDYERMEASGKALAAFRKRGEAGTWLWRRSLKEEAQNLTPLPPPAPRGQP